MPRRVPKDKPSGARSGVVKASRAASTLALAKDAARAVLRASGFQSGTEAEAAGARDVIAAAAVAAQAFGPPDNGASCSGSDNDLADDDLADEPQARAELNEEAGAADSAVDNFSALDISGAEDRSARSSTAGSSRERPCS